MRLDDPAVRVRRVCLTFDDGPDPRWTPRILDLLAQANAPATFFMVGRRALDQPALVRRVMAAGHEIGNHSFSHRHPWTMAAAAAREEVRAGAAAIADLTGQAPQFFRPPHGRLRRCMTEEAEGAGQRLVLWSRSAIDWGPFGSARAIARRLDPTQAGDIVLMHDGGFGINRPHELIEVLPAFLAALGRRGLAPGWLARSAPGAAPSAGLMRTTSRDQPPSP